MFTSSLRTDMLGTQVVGCGGGGFVGDGRRGGKCIHLGLACRSLLFLFPLLLFFASD